MNDLNSCLENELRYEHSETDVKCNCQFPSINIRWPKECMICMRLLPTGDEKKIVIDETWDALHELGRLRFN